MMKWINFVSFISCFLFLVACGTGETGANGENGQHNKGVKDLTGYITKFQETSFLVTGKNPHYQSGVSATYYTVNKDTVIKTLDGEIFSFEDLEMGMKVEVWNTGIILESFPSQATAVTVIVDTTFPIDEQKAIQLALQEVDNKFPWFVKAIEKENTMYKVTLQNLFEHEEEVIVEVEINE